MKLLITGIPKSGKSTVLSELIAGASPRRGFITKELVKDQQRTGFEVEDMNGVSAVLAQTQNPTGIQVGRFYVHPEVLTQFTRNLSHPKTGELLYLDEIGQMQLYSNEFRLLVEAYLDAPNDFAATITSVYSDEFTKHIFNRDDVVLFRLADANRDEVKKSLKIALNNKDVFNRLPVVLQKAVDQYANDYLDDSSYVSFGKLFTNAIGYFLEDRICAVGADTYAINGNTNEHLVRCNSMNDWSCDCPLSNGREPYSEPMDCSHVQAVRLFIANL